MKYEDLSEADKAYVNIYLEDYFKAYIRYPLVTKIIDSGNSLDLELETFDWFPESLATVEASKKLLQISNYLRVHLLPNAR